MFQGVDCSLRAETEFKLQDRYGKHTEIYPPGEVEEAK